MTTEDPFASPPGSPEPLAPPSPPTAAQPGATPPGVLAPGVLSTGAMTPTYASPPVGGYAAPVGPAPVAPAAVATWAIILTGAYTLLTIVSALLTPQTVQQLKDTLADPENAAIDPVSTLLSLVVGTVSIAAFVFLALWMSRIRTNRTALGETPGGPPSVEWWGWFVPFANFVLPLLGMRAISRRIVGWGLLIGWWVPFCLVWVLSPVSASAQFRAIDFGTGEVTNAAALDQMVPLAWASAILLAISWLFLVPIIRKTTARHLSA